jgi:cytoskeletal protein RodZ
MKDRFGKQLKLIRESKGISLEEISQKTRIRLAYLEAIEADNFEALPSKTQARGFIRLYTNELGVALDGLKVKGHHFMPIRSNQNKVVEALPPQSLDQSDDSLETPEDQVVETPPDDATEALETRFEEQISHPKQDQTSETSQNAKQIFEEIGEKLRERRGLISLTLDDINENIHVNRQYLNALEDGRLDELPSPVQAKGMLANYAEFLNLDGDALLLRFADGLQLQRLEKQKAPVNQKMSSKEISSTKLRLKNFFSLDLLVMVGLFIGFTSFIIWGVNRILAVDSQDPLATEIPDVSDVLLATSSVTPETTDEDETPSDPSATPANGEQEITPIFTPIISDNPINIVIIPNQQSWVQITSDYALVYEGRLLPGNAYNYSGDEVVEILTGNAGALQIYFNDQAIGAAGFIGQVEKLTFTETGLVRPTPTNPPTSTPTRQDTPSPTDSIPIEPTTTP